MRDTDTTKNRLYKQQMHEQMDLMKSLLERAMDWEGDQAGYIRHQDQISLTRFTESEDMKDNTSEPHR